MEEKKTARFERRGNGENEEWAEEHAMIDFIINPRSRSGAAYGIWEKTKTILDGRGIQYCAHKTEYAGHAAKIAEELTGKGAVKRFLVVVGGDGTVNEVLNGIDWTCHVVLGYLPTGSGNDFARSMGMTSSGNYNLERAVETILHPSRYRVLDYGIVETGRVRRRFVVSSGIGFDAAVCHNLLHSTAKKILNRIHLTKLCYIVIGLKQLVLTKPVDGSLKLDDGRIIPLKRTAFLSAHIHPYEGGGFCFAPEADDTDGKLDLCVVSDTGRIHMVPVLLAALFGKHSSMAGVYHYRCRWAEIRLEKPKPVHADGESCGIQKEIRVSCIAEKLKVVV